MSVDRPRELHQIIFKKKRIVTSVPFYTLTLDLSRTSRTCIAYSCGLRAVIRLFKIALHPLVPFSRGSAVMGVAGATRSSFARETFFERDEENDG